MLGQFCRRPMFCNDRVSRSRVRQESLITAGGCRDAGAGSPLSDCNCDGSAAGTTDNWGWGCCAVLCTEHVSCCCGCFFSRVQPTFVTAPVSQQPGSRRRLSSRTSPATAQSVRILPPLTMNYDNCFEDHPIDAIYLI